MSSSTASCAWGRAAEKVKNPRQAIAIALSEAGASNQESPAENKERLRRHQGEGSARRNRAGRDGRQGTTRFRRGGAPTRGRLYREARENGRARPLEDEAATSSSVRSEPDSDRHGKAREKEPDAGVRRSASRPDWRRCPGRKNACAPDRKGTGAFPPLVDRRRRRPGDDPVRPARGVRARSRVRVLRHVDRQERRPWRIGAARGRAQRLGARPRTTLGFPYPSRAASSRSEIAIARPLSGSTSFAPASAVRGNSSPAIL